MEFTEDEKVDMIFLYAQCYRNSVLTLQKYRETYPERRQPKRQMFQNIERRLRSEGSFSTQRRRTSSVTNAGGVSEVNTLGN